MDELLSALPDEVFAAAESDLCQGARRDRGRRGMSAEQALRALVLKQLTGMSYEQLSFALDDSASYRAFCRLAPGDRAPKKSTLQGNIKKLGRLTLQSAHRAIVQLGIDRGVEDGRRVTVDSTSVESHIHHPTDSSLLLDCVEKLTSLLWKGAEIVTLRFSDHRKRAKRRALEIAVAKSMEKRVPLYKDLLRVLGFCLEYGRDAMTVLKRRRGFSAGRARALATTLEHYLVLATKVASQTFRRVIAGESVPASEKVVSIHEPHTDVIVKDNRGTVYGHKAFLTVGSSGLILDLVVPQGNPNDVTYTQPTIDALNEAHGIVPEEAAFDGGFCSHANLQELKKRGVKAVAFTAPRGLTIEQMTGSRQLFEQLRAFRACSEGTIGWLKAVFGLRRCRWRGFDSFRSYAWASVLSHNLLLISRALR